MRVTGSCVGHLVFGDVAGLGIQFSDIPGAVGREPDVAVLIHDQPVRAGTRRLQCPFLVFPGAGIHAADHVGILAGIPDRSIASRFGIMRVRALLDVPLLDSDLDV